MARLSPFRHVDLPTAPTTMTSPVGFGRTDVRGDI